MTTPHQGVRERAADKERDRFRARRGGLKGRQVAVWIGRRGRLELEGTTAPTAEKDAVVSCVLCVIKPSMVNIDIKTSMLGTRHAPSASMPLDLMFSRDTLAVHKKYIVPGATVLRCYDEYLCGCQSRLRRRVCV